jgi:perosamine synthetase
MLKEPSVTYLEPALRDGNSLGNRLSTEPRVATYRRGLCPVAESVQPRLLQLKTNCMDLRIAEQKAEALAKTIAYFGR